ncbi:MAG TPA: FG-GAP-like repeat-containing protein, partial [Blastocatellia bacterium]|nr:FG-GAP-like repeat-containing protein [Blastocatellia bacterium]
MTTESLISAESKETVTLHAAGRGLPWINLTDGKQLPADYEGEARIQAAMKRGQTVPTAMASADFDGDGKPDLICGYAGAGSGVVALHRGNSSFVSNYSSSYKGRESKAASEVSAIDERSPFLARAQSLDLPQQPDFLGAGDFNGDGKQDAVAATRGSNMLAWMLGDGRGGFAMIVPTALPGPVRALVVGEANRADGLDDVVVATGGPAPQVLVSERPGGALGSEPEAFQMQAEVTALAIGQLDNSYEFDLAIAAGAEVLIVHGRDRYSPLAEVQQGEASPPLVTRFGSGFHIASLALGDFVWDREHWTEIALLS